MVFQLLCIKNDPVLFQSRTNLDLFDENVYIASKYASASTSKRKGRPPKSKTAAVKNDEAEDMDYLGEESDQSFEEDDLDNASDSESAHRRKKRGRAGSANASTGKVKEERNKRRPGTPLSNMTAGSPSLDTESDYDEIGETKVDRGGNLLGGEKRDRHTLSLPLLCSSTGLTLSFSDPRSTVQGPHFCLTESWQYAIYVFQRSSSITRFPRQFCVSQKEPQTR